MTYCYHCLTPGCGHECEVVKPFAEFNREEICPKCSFPMSRAVSKTSFALKGGGWGKSGYSYDHVTFKNKNGTKETVPVKTKLRGDDE